VSQDNAEFAEFFSASWDPCLRAVAAITGDMTLAEDQVAEAFARAWATWRKVSHHPAPRAWVVRTALNAGASWWHRRSKETALTSHDHAPPHAKPGPAAGGARPHRRLAGPGGPSGTGPPHTAFVNTQVIDPERHQFQAYALTS